MIIDEMIKEKVRVQSLLAKEANYDIAEMMRQTHEEVTKMAKEMGIKLKYAKVRKSKPVPEDKAA